MAFFRFLQWNLLFIVTDMVANMMMGSSFTVRSVLVEWFWWNVAYYLILIMMYPIGSFLRGMFIRIQAQRKK